MVVDVGIVRNYIKPKADSTLYNMRKIDLIEYIRTLEHNYNVAVSFNENQAKYIESLGITEVVRCKDCKHYNPRKQSAHWEQKALCCTRAAWMTFPADGFCSYGERRTN